MDHIVLYGDYAREFVREYQHELLNEADNDRLAQLARQSGKPRASNKGLHLPQIKVNGLHLPHPHGSHPRRLVHAHR